MPPKKGTPAYDRWLISPEREIWLLNRTGEKNHRFGKPGWSRGQKRPEISERMRGDKNPIAGTQRSKETCDRISKSRTGKRWTDEQKLAMSIQRRGKKYRPRSKPSKKRPDIAARNRTEEHRMKQVEIAVGGFCYCNVKYPKRRKVKYCNLFYQMRDEGRIGACWDFKSVLSGEIEDLCYHHVYYHPKCKFENDEVGYYVWINIGANQRPKMHKYYITGDPNKFVPLTRAENSIVNGDKLEWIKIFEDIIEKNGGKCYLTEQEMIEYIKVHGDPGKKRKPRKKKSPAMMTLTTSD